MSSRAPLNKFCSLEVFSYLTGSDLLFTVARMDRATRRALTENCDKGIMRGDGQARTLHILAHKISTRRNGRFT